MTKINQEEYEVLKPKLEEEYTHVGKSRDGKLQFLQGYIERDMKREEWSDGWGQTYMRPVNLFKFIQWEDEEPYNIQELIDEYLDDEYGYFNMKLSREFEEFIKRESEESEIKQLERKVKELDSLNDELIRDNNQFRNELDNQEVLSEEWIERNTSPVDDEGRLYVWKRDLQNVVVSKPELPVVPAWFDEWWKGVTKGGGNLFHSMERFYDELFSSGTRETYEYISNPDNKKKLLNIIINELDYVVEEEQKYYVLDRHEVYLLAKEEERNKVETVAKLVELYGHEYVELNYQLTEREIKDYDGRYFAFAVKVKELEE